MSEPVQNGEELANEHWTWLSTLLERVYKDAFVHGYKHGKESEKKLLSKDGEGEEEEEK